MNRDRDWICGICKQPPLPNSGYTTYESVEGELEYLCRRHMHPEGPIAWYLTLDREWLKKTGKVRWLDSYTKKVEYEDFHSKN